MKTIRKIWLEDGNGSAWGLNGERGAYAADLAGFGYSRSPVFADLTKGFFTSVSDDAEPQNAVTFTVHFLPPNAYGKYWQFSEFLSRAQQLTLGYAPTPDRNVYRRVSVNYIQKGELEQTGILSVPVSLSCLTPWYLLTPSVMDIEADGEDTSKRYSYTYPYLYGSDATASISGTIFAAGHVPAAIELAYVGAAVNPRIRLTGQISGKIYGTCALDTTLQAGDMLLYSSLYTDSYVVRRRGAVDTDLLDVLDLTQNPFFHVPTNEPCTLSLESSVSITGRASVKTYYFYRSV